MAAPGPGRARSSLNHTSLRYFNVVGSGDPTVYDASPYNLFPIVLRPADPGKVPQIYGTDHPTPDGTSVKDYVHVADLARAHVAAARALEAGKTLEPRLQPRQRHGYVGPRDHGRRPPGHRHRLHPD